jgi:anti-sigma factor RsiW
MDLSPITEEELHAFIDGELPAARSDQVSAMLQRDPAQAARVAAFRADKERLAAIFRPVAAAPLPDAWTRRVLQHPRPAAPPRRWRMAAAAALVLAAFGGTAFLLRPQPDAILAEAEAAHDGALLPAQTLTGAALPTLGARDAALETTTGLPLHAPNLSRFGYRLVSVALFDRSHRAASLVYRNTAGADVTIYVRRSNGTARFDLLHYGALRECIWQDDVVGAVILGKMSAGEMMRVASKAYADLDL